MSESAGKMTLNVILKHCSSPTCPYRAGDGDAERKKLVDEFQAKLKHRVADGNDVKTLEKRVGDLKDVIAMAITWGQSRRLSAREIETLKKAIANKET